MTTTSNLSGGVATPTAPAKGSFPLDHLNECREFARAYRQCLQIQGGKTRGCRREAREYLLCRMERGLMAEDEWDVLGLSRDSVPGGTSAETDANKDELKTDNRSSQTKDGFIAGAQTAKRRKERGRTSEVPT